MTKPDSTAVFVTAHEGARRCMVGVETFRAWSSTGLIPKPAIDRGQIMRWHWPSVEAALAKREAEREHDPFVTGVSNVQFTPRKRASRGFAG